MNIDKFTSRYFFQHTIVYIYNGREEERERGKEGKEGREKLGREGDREEKNTSLEGEKEGRNSKLYTGHRDTKR